MGDGRGLGACPLHAEEGCLHGEAAAVAVEGAVGADDAVAGDDEGEGVGGHDAADGAGGTGPAHPGGEPAVGAGLAGGDAQRLRQHGATEARQAPSVGGQAVPVDIRGQVDGLALQFPHYRLSITTDCSGFNQLITFAGIAFLGILTGRSSLGRALLLFAAGVVLAYVANLARILVFVVLVAMLFTACLAGELLERYLFFAAVAAPKMPGSL